jgi:hypothetical protein
MSGRRNQSPFSVIFRKVGGQRSAVVPAFAGMNGQRSAVRSWKLEFRNLEHWNTGTLEQQDLEFFPLAGYFFANSGLIVKHGMIMKSNKIEVKGREVALFIQHQMDYISLTDIAKYRRDADTFSIINNWMRSRSTIEFIGLWEIIHNPGFKPIEFERFRIESGSNYFVLSPKRWIETTNAIGIIAKAGRYGGTYAHHNIAFEFASWISSEFKLYLILEFQRLKEEEQKRLQLDWNLQRTLAKINYHIHTDAIKEMLIPKELSKREINFIYASEADLLNMALFGITAKQWQDQHPDFVGNIRDIATLEQLVVLSNLESINAVMIHQGLKQNERLQQLNRIAITQMKSLLQSKSMKRLK